MEKNRNAVNQHTTIRYRPNGRTDTKHNLMIRETLEQTGTFYYELADLLGKSPSTITVMLRHEMPIDEQEKICELIRQHAGKGES